MLTSKLWDNPQVNARGHLVFGGCDTVELAREYGTPLYVLDEELLRERCRAFRGAFEQLGVEGRVYFASKALSTMAVYRIVASEGLGTDVVSAGELYTALQAGMSPDDIIFHGNNKTDEEIQMAIQAGIGRIAIDSHEEIQIIGDMAARAGKVMDVLLRVKPGVEAHTHEYMTTGTDDGKFGLGVKDGEAMRAVEEILQQPALRLRGIHVHIGSQIFGEEPFALTAEVLAGLVEQIWRRFGHVIDEVNFGGGYGVHYTEDDAPLEPTAYVRKMVETYLRCSREKDLTTPRFAIEPGRAIVGEAGITLYTVGTIKDIPAIRRYISVDGGMGDNPRPALYQAEYTVRLANRPTAAATQSVRIAGRYCESGDILIQEVALPACERGDVLAVFSTGAYNFSMAMGYNRVQRPALILVNRGRSEAIVVRQSLEQIVQNDRIPSWL